MLKSHVKFHSSGARRLILIVDDEAVNREMLGFIVSNDFDVVYAEDGAQAAEVIKKEGTKLSLVLLDLMMPVMNGYDVMKFMKEDEEFRKIPIIVLTSEKGAEVECLKLGASDFIPKPFSMPEVILARMEKTIELHEDRDIIRSTERESLTGLFIKDYFYRYCEQFDQYHSVPMDAVALDISHFRLINEMYGRETGDGVLVHMGGFIKDLIEKTNGIACRVEGDRFFMYLPHDIVDYEAMFVGLNDHFLNYSDINVRVRGGIYLDVDKNISIERRFDRATLMTARMKNDFTKSIAYYDDSIHEREIFEERLVNEFEKAIAQDQFEVYFQPKYNVEQETPVLSSAEALVRWKHPKFGMISPGIFIPLFEKNGLIQKLDYHLWARTARMIREWKDELGIYSPVSINVSRVDLYHSDLPEFLQGIIKENGLSVDDILLEITESAYTENPDQVISMIEQLRNLGFRIEMDDFGTGYSSLNMLADVPVDILKLDMKFVQNLRSNEKRETLIRLIMDIARYLNVLVVAEGVEDEDQVAFLRSVGCNIIQGYYFSRPLPEADFRKLLKKTKEA